MLDNTNVKKHWHLWRTLKDPDIEEANLVLQNEKLMEDNFKEYRKMINSHMVVAALVATAALTAGFTMPGGYDGEQGPNPGSAVLSKRSSFHIFELFDTCALLFSIVSLFLYFVTTLQRDVNKAMKYFKLSVACNCTSVVSIVGAFIAGTYSTLERTAKDLAIISCVISSVAIFIMYFAMYRFRIN